MNKRFFIVGGFVSVLIIIGVGIYYGLLEGKTKNIFRNTLSLPAFVKDKTGFSQNKQSETDKITPSLTIYTADYIQMAITDNSGNITGYDPTSKSIKYDIPDSTFYFDMNENGYPLEMQKTLHVTAAETVNAIKIANFTKSIRLLLYPQKPVKNANFLAYFTDLNGLETAVPAENVASDANESYKFDLVLDNGKLVITPAKQ